jgi:hypothetical protein
MEKARLAAAQAILTEVVKPARKIRGTDINHVSSFERRNQAGQLRLLLSRSSEFSTRW